MNERTIRIHFEYPPIPTRDCDYLASFDDDEPDDDGHMLVGVGRTPWDAVFDLLAWVDE